MIWNNDSRRFHDENMDAIDENAHTSSPTASNPTRLSLHPNSDAFIPFQPKVGDQKWMATALSFSQYRRGGEALVHRADKVHFFSMKLRP